MSSPTSKPTSLSVRAIAFSHSVSRTSHSIDDDDDQVPFYLMETLGGAKTIRGYDEFRFRDARNLYVSAEYRWEVWPFVDFSLFFDAGKVFDDLDDFNFDKMHTGYGVGLRIHTPEAWRFAWMWLTVPRGSSCISVGGRHFDAWYWSSTLDGALRDSSRSSEVLSRRSALGGRRQARRS